MITQLIQMHADVSRATGLLGQDADAVMQFIDIVRLFDSADALLAFASSRDDCTCLSTPATVSRHLKLI
jgi:hypothetical protein